MPVINDGPSTKLFKPIALGGNVSLAGLAGQPVSKNLVQAIPHAPSGRCTAWGIPFAVGGKVVLVQGDTPVTRKIAPLRARWLVFMHASDLVPSERDEHGFYTPPLHGAGGLMEHAADYVLIYADGSEHRFPIHRRHQVGAFQRGWGENCFQAVSHHKPYPVRPHHEQMNPSYGQSQTRALTGEFGWWTNWLWAAENPHADKAVVGIRFEPRSGAVVVSAVSAGNVQDNPIRWQTRRKCVVKLPRGVQFDSKLDDNGLLSQIQLDMGQVISATGKPSYPNATWAKTYNNKLPEVSSREILVEYAAHDEACFHLVGGKTVPVKSVASGRTPAIQHVAAATQRVTVRVVDSRSKEPVAVKLHIHGQAGEYLAPVDRHRIPNWGWFEDYSVDFTHCCVHHCSYIRGETHVDLPLGKVFVEVSKGFEIRPVRKAVTVTRATKEITVAIEKVLPWREAGWVTADTHVHFLSPTSALLEGAGEGVNIVNLLASQWGELMTNTGDFDGRTTHGSRQAGGDGEYLVRVGTENRQHVLGHISLLGYKGGIIAPMTTGGPDESAIGDSIEILLTEWARQCAAQGGVVIIPHFPNPRAEHAAAIVDGHVSGVEMTAWNDHYSGINPYSLCDWYRYLNCGYFVAAVGGTDKMWSSTAVGTVRTYARITGGLFTYDAWMQAVRDGRTFVTYGPLIDFTVDGREAGEDIRMSATGGTVDVTWRVASVTVPMTKVELIVNGEVRQSQAVNGKDDRGHWRVKVDKSSWVALLVRGRYADKPEMIAAHSSPVMVDVKGSQFLAAADAMTILDQIEGSLAFLDTVGTKAQTAAYKRMRLTLTGVHRQMHNRMHHAGYLHNHTATADHKEHH